VHHLPARWLFDPIGADWQGMIVSYEELQTDVVGAMTRVARFLGLAVSLPEMQRVYGKDVGVFKKSKEGLAMPTFPQLHAHDA
jgi:hypothetical protein